MRSLTFIVLFILALSRGFAGESTPPRNAQQAYEELLSIKYFAFGGVGITGQTSRGELCYREIASSTNRLQLFHLVLTKGTAEAQLYALCGIRQYAPSEFDAAAAPIMTADKNVSEMAGCTGMRERASKIVARIKSGSYDFYLTRTW